MGCSALGDAHIETEPGARAHERPEAVEHPQVREWATVPNGKPLSTAGTACSPIYPILNWSETPQGPTAARSAFRSEARSLLATLPQLEGAVLGRRRLSEHPATHPASVRPRSKSRRRTDTTRCPRMLHVRFDTSSLA